MATLGHYLPVLPALTTVFTTGLNSLADGARVLSSAIDNNGTPPAGGLPLIFFSLDLASWNPAAGGWFDIFIIPGDGTNFGRGSDSVEPAPHYHVERLQVEAAGAAARTLISRRWRDVGCNHFKILLRNNSGTALAGTGNTLSYALGAPVSKS